MSAKPLQSSGWLHQQSYDSFTRMMLEAVESAELRAGVPHSRWGSLGSTVHLGDSCHVFSHPWHFSGGNCLFPQYFHIPAGALYHQIGTSLQCKERMLRSRIYGTRVHSVGTSLVRVRSQDLISPAPLTPRRKRS